MLIGVWTVLPTLVTLLLSILSLIHGKFVGERCMINNPDRSSTSGICKTLQNCPPVFEELLAGKVPDTHCGFLGFDPIVCCPTSNVIITRRTTLEPTTSTERTNTPQALIFDDSRGSLARAKCEENVEAVYGSKKPLTFGFDETPANQSKCGPPRVSVVGGQKAAPKEFPHMTAIGYDGENGISWLCGGSLISDRVVLTAAHCLYTADLGSAKWARLGDLNLVQTNDQAEPQTLKIVERIAHPDYKAPSEYHDIAVVKLENPVVYNEWVRPACLPVDLPDVGYKGEAVATGWGRVDWADESGSDHLLTVTLKLVSHATCNESFFDGENNAQLPLGIVDNWQVCAGEVGKDTCQGDSGGPLAIFNAVHDCMYNVIGVTSVGHLCGSIIPGVYTRVYHYVPWIERAAWPEYFQTYQWN